MPRVRFSALWLCLALLLALASCHHGGSGGGAKKDQVISLDEITGKIRDHPADPDLYIERARFYLGKQSFDNAIVDIRKAISLNEKNADYFVLLSEVYLLDGKTKECSDALLRANALSPGNNQVILKLANLNLIIKDYAKTFDYVTKALAIKRVNPQAYFIRAIAFLEKGDTSKGVNDLMKAVDQDQNYFEAYMQLGDLYAIKNDPMAASYFTNAIRVRGNSKEAYYRLGMYYQDNGQFEKALDTYRKLLTADTSFRNAPYNMGYIYLVYLNDFPKAIEYFTLAIQRDPEYYEAWYNRGYAYELSGKPEEAYRDYKKTLQIEVNYPKAIDGLNRLDALRAQRK
jgi:tetratricopeptide (TPR) repeat protein